MNCTDVFNTLYKNEQKKGCPDDLIKAQSWIINVRKTVNQKEEIDRYNFMLAYISYNLLQKYEKKSSYINVLRKNINDEMLKSWEVYKKNFN